MTLILKYKYVAVFTAICMLFFCGSCTEISVKADDEIVITTAEELLAISENPAGRYKLANDIDMSGKKWKPVDFTGEFDGCGYSIVNLEIETTGDSVETTYDGNMKTYDTGFAGFFATLKGASVKNLRLVNIKADITVKKPCFVGGIAGYMDNSVIENCYIDGRLFLEVDAGMFGIGGFAGFGNGEIKASSADVTLVCIDTNEAEKDEQFMGGGYAAGYISMDDCSIKLDGYDSDHGYVHNGGMVGMFALYPAGTEADTYITDNYVEGKITFFEDNTDRRAYCDPYVGEVLNWTYEWYGCSESFERDERYDYSKNLLPDMCDNPSYRSKIVDSTDVSLGYTEYTCDGCGYTYKDDYTIPEGGLKPRAKELDAAITKGSVMLSELSDWNYDSDIYCESGDCIEIKSDTPMKGVYVIWNSPVSAWSISYNNSQQECGQYGFLHDYVELDEEATECKINIRAESGISEIHVYSEGCPPENVQLWEAPSDGNADILVFSTHADDEILFLGGVLATYAGEMGLRVQLAYMTNYWDGLRIREHEKLDGIWACGVRNYPVNAEFSDLYATTLEEAMAVYNYDDVLAFVTEQIRRFKPHICVTQDLNGEYGHGGHMLLAKAVCEAADNSMNKDFCSESADMYGEWDVPKTYLHLYPENKLIMNLREPLANMGGQTAVEVATEAYKLHVSQQWCWFYVSDEGENSCADYGLYRTTVGADTGNDMLEHITTYAELEEIARQEQLKQEEEERKRKEEELQSATDATSEESGASSGNSPDDTDKDKKSSGKQKSKLFIIIVALELLAIIAVSIVLHRILMKRRRKR